MVDWGRDRNMTFSRTKPECLYPILKDIEWSVPFLFDRIYQIDYDIPVKHFTAYPFSESLDRSIKPVVIVTIYGGYGTNSYRWLRPNIDAIVEERNFKLIYQFFEQDILSHL
jgi:hypothetical protein